MSAFRNHQSLARIRTLCRLFALASLLMTGPVLGFESEAPGDQTAKGKQDSTASAAEGDSPQEEPALRLHWYGYIKFDSSWDESLVDTGNFARWVASPSVVEEHSHFNMTARQSRFGVDLEQSFESRPPIRAKIEIDFYGGGAENKNRPQLRHAYFDLAWPERGWMLRTGQTSDVISPLAPSTLNYTVAWWAGNIGYRRPMARLTKTHATEAGDTKLTLALSRTIGDDFGSAEPGDSGVDSGVPTLQVAASKSWRNGAGRKATVGISGHFGQELLEERRGTSAPEFDSWSANFDLQLPLAEKASLKAEAWRGQNLDDYFGGIGQGVNFGREFEIEASGGWLAIETRMSQDVLVSIGAGMDDPKDESLPFGARSRNQTLWANLLWDFRQALRFGVEGSWWQTDYIGLDQGSSLRLETSLIYSFAH